MRNLDGSSLVAAALAVTLVACSESSNVGPDPQPEAAIVPVHVGSAPALSLLVVEVTAADIATPLAFNLTLVDGMASDTITIPAGSNRTLTVRAYDANDIETHRGSVVTDLTEGTNPAVTITLRPIAGDQPIVVVIGGITVEVAPASDTIGLDDVVQLTAAVLDEDGDTLEVSPMWATLDPAVATVSPSGLVTGLASGTAGIVATFGGAGGAATVEVLGEIAFATDRDGDFEIYVMRSDGVGASNLSNSGSDDRSPAWSPDGSQIAFYSDRGGDIDIYVMDADGSNPTNNTNTAGVDRFPAWSPSGLELLFSTDRSGDEEIFVMDADGSNQVNLTNDPSIDRYPSWSPDGSKIAFTSSRDGNLEVYVMNADGSNPVNLSNNAADDTSPQWSPDGSKIAFYTTRDGNEEVYVMSTDGSGQVNITNDPGIDRFVAWSPDGSSIVFDTMRDGNWELYVMNADGTGPINITNSPAEESGPAWSPR